MSQSEFLDQFDDEFDEIAEMNREVEDINHRSEEVDEEEAIAATEKMYDAQKDKNLKGIVPSTFAESVYLLDGRPFRLRNRDYLRLIYDAEIKEGLLMCGRQVEKSTTFSVMKANWTLLTPFFRSLYFAPLNEQVKVFSEDRLGRLFTYSQEDIIKRTFIDTKDKQNVFNKSFSNGALNYLRHCYSTGDNIRGLSVNGVFGDEIQDIDIDALPVISECQAHAHDLGPGIKMTWYAGTPKTYSNTIQHLWDDSTQCEWVVRCPHCNRDQVLGLENITPDKYVCRNKKCGRELTSDTIAQRGRWIKLNEDSKKWGFRINQMICPAMPASDVYEKCENYDSQRLNNEVLGRSFENADKPFTPTLIASMFDNNYKMLARAEGEFTNSRIYMGIDWGTGGKSFTIVSVYAWNRDGKFQLLFSRKYEKANEVERDYQVKDVIMLMGLFRVTYCIADYGHGFQSNQQLKKRLGERFDCMYYSHSLADLRTYNKKKQMWVVHRTRTIDEYVVACQNGKMEWPGENREELKYLEEHHLAEQTEYRNSKPKAGNNVMITRSEDMYYSHPPNQPDDGLHAGVYAYTAALIHPNGVGSGIVFTGAISR